MLDYAVPIFKTDLVTSACIFWCILHVSVIIDTLCVPVAEKASVYTYPAALLPILNPLMKVLAYLFPDEGIRSVRPPQTCNAFFKHDLHSFVSDNLQYAHPWQDRDP